MIALSRKRLYKNHGKTIGWWEVEAQDLEDGTAQLRITFAKTMDGAVVEKFVPIAAKNVGRANETTPNQQAMAEAVSRVAKQKDGGYVEELADADAPATNASGGKKPMLAQKIQDVPAGDIDWSSAFAQPKLDGHRALHHGDFPLYSRNGKPIKLPHILTALARFPGVYFDGELYCHGKTLQEIGSLAKDPREESACLEYHVYDIIIDLPFAERYAMLAKVLGQLPFQVQGSVTYSPIKLVSTVKVDSEEGRQALHRAYIEQGYEGSILRHSPQSYADGKRSRQLIKATDRATAEYKVVGYEEGTPSVKKGVTYKVPVWVMDVGDGTGRTFKATAQGDMKKKNAEWEARDSFIGQNNVVEHFGFTPDGIPHQPVSKCWESDKEV